MRRGIHRTIFAAVSLGALAGACGSFATNSDPPPAQPSETDASVADALAEAPSAADAAVDAATEKPPTSACVGAEHWLCDDFDDAGSALAPHWIANGEVTIVPESNPQHSPPNVVSLSASLGLEASIGHATNGTARGLSCSFWVRIVKSEAAEAILFDMTLSTTGAFYKTAIRRQPGNASATLSRSSNVISGGENVNDGFSLSLSEWHRVELAIAGGGKPTATLKIDGMDEALSDDPRLAAVASFNQESVEFLVRANGTWTVLYDDIICNTIP